MGSNPGNDTVLIFNSAGAQGQTRRNAKRSVSKPLMQAALSGLSNIDYYGNGWWLGSTGGNSMAVLGNVIQAAMSSYPHAFGNAQKQNANSPVMGIRLTHHTPTGCGLPGLPKVLTFGAKWN
jgi:hypothetical protein